jgi:hypothetical protein
MMTTHENKIDGRKQMLFFTPSYRNDLDRLLLMRKSMRKYYQGNGRHIIAVPDEDLKLFSKALLGDSCELIAQNDLVISEYFPNIVYKAISNLVPGQAWRFNKFAGKGGWIIQQIAKLASFELASEGPIIILDSDLFFVRPFGNADLLTERGRLLVRILPDTESGKHRKHIANARRFLGLPEGGTEHHYMSCPAVLHAEWLKELMHYVEARFNKPWQQALLEEQTMSEYSIYGVFVEEILKPSDLIIRETSFNHMLWDDASYNRFIVDPETEISRNPEKVCVVVQSALKIPAQEYRRNLESLLVSG